MQSHGPRWLLAQLHSGQSVEYPATPSVQAQGRVWYSEDENLASWNDKGIWSRFVDDMDLPIDSLLPCRRTQS